MTCHACIFSTFSITKCHKFISFKANLFVKIQSMNSLCSFLEISLKGEKIVSNNHFSNTKDTISKLANCPHYLPYPPTKKHRLWKSPQPMFNFISCRQSASCGYSHYISLTQLQLSQCSLNYNLLAVNSFLEDIKTCDKILI